MKSADQRLRRKSEFDAVFQGGLRASSGALALRARRRSGETVDDPCRFGFAISSKLGGAVVRNRIRRRLRESVSRLNREGNCKGLDVVIVARDGAAQADYGLLDTTLTRLVGKTMRQADGRNGLDAQGAHDARNARGGS